MSVSTSVIPSVSYNAFRSAIFIRLCGPRFTPRSIVISTISPQVTPRMWQYRMMLRPFLAVLAASAAFAQAPAPTSGHRVHRLLIHNATVVDGNGTPAAGPKDIIVEDNRIVDVIALDPVALSRNPPPGMGNRANAAPPDAVIDATGKY